MPRRHLTTPIPLSEIARVVNGVVHGDATTPISSLCSFDTPTPHAITFSRVASSPQLTKVLADLRCGAVIVDHRAVSPATPLAMPLIAVTDPVLAMTKVVPLFFEGAERTQGISPKADVDPGAKIGARVTIGAFSSIGPRVVIEDDVVIHPHVVLYPGVHIGARTVLHSGAIIREECVVGADSLVQNGAVVGADGFGYTPDPTLGLAPVPQVGTVVLGDRVDIGANSCIDRATFGETKIGLGTKIDNLVQVGHNTVIGRHSILCGQVGIAGSSVIGDQVVLAGSAGVADHISIASGARFASRSGVVRDITSKGDYAGYPAVPVRQWNRALAALLRLGKPGAKDSGEG
jgi:UDP-3-O-[3-hydroxymyristoyl] glucosamine N-acyltransferase